MGNSEVGHLNLGAGRVVRQDLVRIDDDVASGAFFREPGAGATPAARRAASALHLMGLVSDGGVHSHIRHLRALIELARREGVEHVHVHAFTDGRDVSPTSGAGFLETGARIWQRCAAATTRWTATAAGTATKRAYDAIVHGVGARADDPVAAVGRATSAGVTDEFIEPVVIGDPAQRAGSAAATRWSSSTSGPTAPAQLFAGAARAGLRRVRPRAPTRRCPHLVQMTEYSEDFARAGRLPVEPVDVGAGTGARGQPASSQLHVAETEKYPHVTYFFDGGSEHRSAGEEWELVDSPRDVATYDQKPEHERRRGLPTCSATASPTSATASAWSTSPTPTWSATPA